MIPPLLAIFSYPLVVVALFRAYNARMALIWTILLGYLFLPTKTQWNLPVLPAITKDSMPVIAAALCLLVLASRMVSTPTAPVLPGWIPRHPVIRFLIFCLVAGALLTVLTNRDALTYGSLRLPGLRLYDGFSAILSTVMAIMPLLLARKYLASDDSQKLILHSLCIAGVIYSLPIIFELIMSPQLNRMVYGFFPHSWSQHVRGGGYRPLVFLRHGLWLGIFMCVAVLAAVGYARIATSQRKFTYIGIAAWLLLILMAAKSLGAFAIALVLAPAILFLNPRAQLLLAAVIAGTVLIYPTLRGAGLIPVQYAVSVAENIDPARGRSLQHRLNNEDVLLEKANRRALFGWGGWGRARIYNEAGRDISTTDGMWVIIIGKNGWLGYIGRFGLLCIPILLLAFRRRADDVTLTTSALSLVLAGNLIDLIPNAGLTPVTWMIAGALVGRLELQKADDDIPEAEGGKIHERRVRFTRFGPKRQRPTAQVQPGEISPAKQSQKTRFAALSTHQETPNAF